MPDAGLDFAFAIGIAHPTGQRDRSIVSQHVAIERVEGRIVEVGLQDPFAQIVEDDHPNRPAQAAEGSFVQLGPDLGARAPDQQPNGFARKA